MWRGREDERKRRILEGEEVKGRRREEWRMGGRGKGVQRGGGKGVLSKLEPLVGASEKVREEAMRVD